MSGGSGIYLCLECTDVEFTTLSAIRDHFALHAAAARIPVPAIGRDEVEIKTLKRQLGRLNGVLNAKGKPNVYYATEDVYELEAAVAEATEKVAQANRLAPNAPGSQLTAPHHRSLWEVIDEGLDMGMRPFDGIGKIITGGGNRRRQSSSSDNSNLGLGLGGISAGDATGGRGYGR